MIKRHEKKKDNTLFETLPKFGEILLVVQYKKHYRTKHFLFSFMVSQSSLPT
jgi:S-methylmethionine-dependent homocysteine/selenocysteine methylase